MATSKTLLILNDPPYGTERSYNGMRLANALSKGDDDEVRLNALGGMQSTGRVRG